MWGATYVHARAGASGARRAASGRAGPATARLAPGRRAPKTSAPRLPGARWARRTAPERRPTIETVWLRLAIALAIGLLVGTERERRSGEEEHRAPAGIRTFMLVALLGGIALQLGGVAPLVLAGAAVLVMAVAGYILGDPGDRGITSEVALLEAFFLGAFAQREPVLASGLAVIVTIVLAARTGLHDFARRLLTRDELRDALLLGAVALVVLPLAPDRPFGPWGTLNLRTVWRLVVLVMAISSAGYAAIRLFGPHVGLPLAGMAGGFVSSLAAIGSLGSRAKADPSLWRPATAGAVLSTVSTLVLLAVVVAATSHDVLRAMAWPLLLAGAVAAAYGAAFALHTAAGGQEKKPLAGRAFSLRAALLFAATVTVVMMLAAGVNQWLGRPGLVIAVAAAGFADTHAAAISTAALAASGEIAPEAAVLPILAALSTNTVSKAAAAVAAGGWRFAWRVIPGLLLVLGAAWAGTRFGH